MSDDYLDDMKRLFDNRDDLEQVLSAAGDPVGRLLRDARESLQERPDEPVRAAHLMAASAELKPMVTSGAAIAGASRWNKAISRTKSFAIKTATAVVALGSSMVGLAYAGVDLPGKAAEQAIESVTGLELPNQGLEVRGEGSDVDDAVRSVIENRESYTHRCEFGQDVAGAATGDEAGPDQDPCAADETEAQGSKATGEQKSAEGRAKATEGRAEGDAASAEGRAKGDSASSEGRSTGETKATEGRATGDAASSEGRSTGETKSTEGQSTGDSASTDGRSKASENQSSGETASEEATSRRP